MQLSRQQIDQLESRKRANLINSITGIKPANLVGTKSANGVENLAIFNSIVHLGSNPPLIGLIMRPVGEVPRHTYANIKASGHYTINAVPNDKTEAAHFTSAKFEEDESEFEACHFQPRYIGDFDAPFVKESPIKFGLSLVEEIPIRHNGTIFMIGEIMHLFIQDALISKEGYIDLDKVSVAGISGLNSYYDLKMIDTYPYAQKENLFQKKD